MLTSFFGKSKPINILIVSLYLITGYVFWVFTGHGEIINFQIILKHLLFASLYLFSLFLFDFINRKNGLTKTNTYSILLFCCFIVMIPVIFSDRNILISNLFLLFALRRILSLSSEKKINKKILDASLWITVASLFYFWSLLFFIILFIAILQKPSKNYRQVLIPFIGFFTVFTLITSYQILWNDSFLWFLNLDTTIGTDFKEYKSLSIFIPILVISTLIIWTLINRFLMFSSILKKNKPNYIIMFIVLMTSILITMLTNEKTGAELFFIIAPLAIITANYIENSMTYWFKELLLWSVVFLPVFILYFIES